MNIVLENTQMTPLTVFQINLLETVLDGIEHHLVDPVIAGGAPREWFFGRSAKDIDIFIRNSVKDIDILIEIIESSFDCTTKVTLSTDLNEEYRSKDIHAVIDMYYQHETFQFILTDTEVGDLLINFPCSICKIMYKDGILYPTHNFMSSVRNSHLVFKPGISEEYKSRMRNYFSNYTDNERTITLNGPELADLL